MVAPLAREFKTRQLQTSQGANFDSAYSYEPGARVNYRNMTASTSLTHTKSLVYGSIWFLLRPRYSQQHLVTIPNAGDVIAGTGGLRKIRWTVAGRGKRGGTRVIYHHVVAQAQIRMILIYRKEIKDNLTPKEKTVLQRSMRSGDLG